MRKEDLQGRNSRTRRAGRRKGINSSLNVLGGWESNQRRRRLRVTNNKDVSKGIWPVSALQVH